MITPATIAPHVGTDLPVLVHRIDDGVAEVRCTVLSLVQIARARLRIAGYVCKPITQVGESHRFRIVGWKATP